MLTHGVSGLFEKVRRFTQIDADHLTIIRGVPGNRHDQCQIVSRTTEHPRHVNQWRQFTQIHQRTDRALRALPVQGVKQVLVTAPQQFGDLDSGHNISHRIVRRTVLDTVSCGEVLESETGETILSHRPLDPRRAQRPVRTGHIQQIPTAVAVLPFPAVGITEAAPEGKPGDLIVKANRVVANPAGFRLSELLVNTGDECHLGQPPLRRQLRRNTGHPDRGRMRQPVWGRACVEGEGFANDL